MVQVITLNLCIGAASKYKRLWNPSAFRYEKLDLYIEMIANISIILAYLMLQLALFRILYPLRTVFCFPLLTLLNLNFNLSEKLQGRDTIFLAVVITIMQLFFAALIDLIPNNFTFLSISGKQFFLKLIITKYKSCMRCV